MINLQKSQEELIKILENEILECDVKKRRCDELLRQLKAPDAMVSKKAQEREAMRQKIRLQFEKRVRKMQEKAAKKNDVADATLDLVIHILCKSPEEIDKAGRCDTL